MGNVKVKFSSSDLFECEWNAVMGKISKRVDASPPNDHFVRHSREILVITRSRRYSREMNWKRDYCCTLFNDLYFRFAPYAENTLPY